MEAALHRDTVLGECPGPTVTLRGREIKCFQAPETLGAYVPTKLGLPCCRWCLEMRVRGSREWLGPEEGEWKGDFVATQPVSFLGIRNTPYLERVSYFILAAGSAP